MLLKPVARLCHRPGHAAVRFLAPIRYDIARFVVADLCDSGDGTFLTEHGVVGLEAAIVVHPAARVERRVNDRRGVNSLLAEYLR